MSWKGGTPGNTNNPPRGTKYGENFPLQKLTVKVLHQKGNSGE